MLISGHKLTVRKNVEFTLAQIQFLIDFEAGLANMGIFLEVACVPCANVGDDPICRANADLDVTPPRFTVECGCSLRAYQGDDVVPPPSPRPLAPRQFFAIKPEVALTRDQMKLFDTADQLLRQLRMKYSMRCMRCEQEDRPTRHIWGARASTQSEYLVECDCTKRVYRGADAPATGR